MDDAQAITFALQEKVAELSAALLSKHPTMPSLLQTIHKTLRQYPEQVTVLSPQELNVVVEGLKVQTMTVFAEKTTKPSTSATASLKKAIASKGADAF